jgi:ribonuclease BN (tRNA processing enzyme)
MWTCYGTPDVNRACMQLLAMFCAAALFISTTAIAVAAEEPSKTEKAAPTKTKVVLLGTGGGPTPKPRNAPASAVIVNEKIYVVDAGDGVARQLYLSGKPLRNVRAVFITHHHSDHNADYCNLLLLSWAAGRRNVVDAYGPPPLEKMTKLCIEMNEWDINLRQEEEHRPNFTSLVRAHEFHGDGEIYKDENVKVTAFLVPHYGAKPAYGFRFDTPDKVIVFSGDTSGSENLIRHAKNADLLIHEVVNEEGVNELVARIDPGNVGLKDHIIKAHTPTTELGKIAAAAQVKKLVLTHFVPAGGPFDKDELWPKDVRKDYSGPIIVGRDLMEID